MRIKVRSIFDRVQWRVYGISYFLFGNTQQRCYISRDVIFENDYIQGNSNEVEVTWPIEERGKKVAKESIPSQEQRRNQESSDNEVNDVKSSTKDITKAEEDFGMLIVRTSSKPKKILEC